MGKFFLVVILLAVAWYMWKDDVKSYFAPKPVAATVSKEDEWCEIKGMECADVVRMLNSFSPTRYFEAAGDLLGTSFENLTMQRGDGEIIFSLPNDIKVVHKQSGREKGFMTVTFDDGFEMKYDKKGNLISAQEAEKKYDY